jgi:hypothetical protein
MTNRTLGDAPVDPEFYETMTTMARLLDEAFNGEAAQPRAHGQQDEREVGFVLLVFPFGDKKGRCNYISNGADRRDIVTMFKEQIKRFEGQPEMKGQA